MNKIPHDAHCKVILYLHRHRHLHPPCNLPLHSTLALNLSIHALHIIFARILALLLRAIDNTNEFLHITAKP
jgi:hypothetical protein